MYFSHLFFAQEGSQAASEVIRQSLQLSQDTVEAWQRIWDAAIDPDVFELWAGTVSLGRTLGALSILYLAVKYAPEMNNTTSWSKLLEMFQWPLTVFVFLLGNGRLLAQVVRVFRAIGYSQVSKILEIQLVGITFRQAVEQVRLNNLSTRRIQQIYGECINLVGKELNDCWQSKQTEAQEMLNQLGTSTNISPAQNFLDVILNFTVVGGIRQVGSFIQGGFAQVLQDKFIPVLETILYAVQWAFINILDACLLGTAVFAPIALGLSILPTAGRLIIGWGSAMIALFAIQMGYNIFVGIIAVVLVSTTGEFAEVVSDLGFLLIVAIFAPVIAYRLGKGGGVALFETASRKAAQSTTVATSAVSTLTNLFLLKRMRS